MPEDNDVMPGAGLPFAIIDKVLCGLPRLHAKRLYAILDGRNTSIIIVAWDRWVKETKSELSLVMIVVSFSYLYWANLFRIITSAQEHRYNDRKRGHTSHPQSRSGCKCRCRSSNRFRLLECWIMHVNKLEI